MMRQQGTDQQRQWASVVELALLLAGVPFLLLYFEGHYYRHGALLLGGGYVIWRLHGAVAWRTLFAKPPPGWWEIPLWRGIAVFLGAVAYVRWWEPDLLWYLPKHHPGIWLLVLVGYPALSVIPQEIIYRVYIFEAHRYLWSKPWQPIFVSALLFGWVHIIFTGWFAVVTTVVGGGALAATYNRWRYSSGALWPVVLEHTLYGLTMFTVGLGKYFFLAR